MWWGGVGWWWCGGWLPTHFKVKHQLQLRLSWAVIIYIIIFFYFFLAPQFLEVMIFLHISSSWVKIRLHTENQLPRLPGSALKVPGGVHYGYKVRYTTAIRWLPTHY